MLPSIILLNNETPKIGDPDYKPYDGKNLSYAGTFNSPLKTFVIKSLELITGKLTLMRLVRDYEKTLRQEDETFWSKALSHLQIKGDNGETGLGDGTRVPKYSLRVNSYGSVDETNATVGLARLYSQGEMDVRLGAIQNDSKLNLLRLVIVFFLLDQK